ncbi:MAG: hypothetical protein CMJ39_09255 [Phycisphaerae bacterium]|nr:hypothetical protein [Phycisphaerae bacterium]
MIRYLFLILILAFGSSTATADQAKSEAPHLNVGLFVSPPFVMKAADGYTGLSIDLWELMARDLGWTFTYVEYPLDELLDNVEQGKVDIAVGPISRTVERERRMDFTPTYLNSGLAMASRAKPVRTFLDVLAHLGDQAFLQLTLSLIVICLVFGLLMWWAERHRNKDHFGGQMVHGFGSGFWWSMVTMSTVGYGDKAPRTTMGRAVGLIWIFLSIVLLAAFTGTIASSMTVGRMGTELTSVHALRHKVVGVVKGSEANHWLSTSHIPVQSYESVQEGLNAVLSHDIDIFVGDRPSILWQMAQQDEAGKIIVQDNIHPERLAFAVPESSPYHEQIDIAMLKEFKSRMWADIESEFGEEQIMVDTTAKEREAGKN